MIGHARFQTSRILATRHRSPSSPCRRFSILAVETSCDDTCISILTFDQARPQRRPVVSHSKIVRSLHLNEVHGGIHPLIALESHKANIENVVDEALQVVQDDGLSLSLLACTQGPGMRRSLEVGIDATSALSRRLNVPLMGVHHMQAHALTPRLLEDGPAPTFPYLSLLVSGGHTLLVRSDDVMRHSIIATTLDVAVGDMIDKVARHTGIAWGGNMPGAALEKWCCDEEASRLAGSYIPITVDEDNFGLTRPMHAKINIRGRRYERMGFSFAGLGTSVERLYRSRPDMSEHSRKAIAGQAMRHAFEHISAKVVCALDGRPMCHPLTHSPIAVTKSLDALIVSGGVARNAYLRQILQRSLKQAGLHTTRLIAPPLDLCSDNATMIAWTAWELLRSGVEPMAPRDVVGGRAFEARPKWPIDLLSTDDESFIDAMTLRNAVHPHGQPRMTRP